MGESSLVFIGKIVSLDPIPDADRILSATVVCGTGGKWVGVVQKDKLRLWDSCVVYLPDSLVPHSDELKFLEPYGWRVSMHRFRKARSEVVIMPLPEGMGTPSVGMDITEAMGVTKYFKPIPENLNGKFKGYFPSFVPKTDEPHYQVVPELVDALVGKPYYSTEKIDGSSTTAYKFKGEFGVCSRNLEIIEDPANGYWKVAMQYGLKEHLAEGMALQWETYGSGVQGNPLGIKGLDGLAFSAYDIVGRRYLEWAELVSLSNSLGFPMARIVEQGDAFSKEGMEKKGEGLYRNGSQREGVVIRSKQNTAEGKPISFKVINLNYKGN
jgi:RNA ligase (TIGR02306 family)